MTIPAHRPHSRLPMGTVTREPRRMAQFAESCERILAVPLDGPTFGLDFRVVCDGARRVEFQPLDLDDKVRIATGVIQIHDAYARSLAGGDVSLEVASLRISLFFVHELAHLPQGLGAYPTVGAVRAVDEGELLHLDLAADHVAVLSVQRAGLHTLAEVKRFQAQSLGGFPVAPSHSPVARHRKARRSVSLCADALENERSAEEGGHVSASFLPQAQHLLLTTHGAGAPKALHAFTVSPEVVTRPCAAADRRSSGGSSVAETTEALRALMAHPRLWSSTEPARGVLQR